MITAVDQGLERLLREQVPLPPELADISFDAPDGTWGAQLSRITISLFLFEVTRSPLPPQAPAQRTRDDGRLEQRPALPLIQLNYLVSAWAGDTADEHQVLGDVLACLLRCSVLPATYIPQTLPGAVHLSISQRNERKPGEVWGGLQQKVKPAFELEATFAFDREWILAAPAVTQVEGAVSRRPDPPAAQSSRSPYASGSADGSQPPQVTRRRNGSAVVAEGRPADQ